MRIPNLAMRHQLDGVYVQWAKKGVLAIMDQGIFSGTNFVISVLLARWMTEDDYGAFAYGFSLYLFISGFYNVLLLEPLSIFGAAKHTHHFRPYLFRLMVLHTLLSCIVGIILFLAAAISWFVDASSRLAPVLFGLSMGHGASLMFWLVRRSYYVQNRVEKALRGTLTYAFVTLVGFVALNALEILSPWLSFVWLGIAALVASTFALLPASYSLPANLRDMLSLRNVARENWLYGRWLTISAVLHWLSGNAYYVLAGTLLTLTEVAGLKALQNLAAPVTQVITAINLLFLPWAARRYAQSGAQNLKRDTLLLMLFSAGITVTFFGLLIVFQDSVFKALYKDKYADSQQYLILIGLFSTTLALQSAWSMALKIREKTALVTFANVLGALFTVTLGVVLVKNLGLLGAVWGLVVSGSAGLLTLFVIELYLYRQSNNTAVQQG